MRFPGTEIRNDLTAILEMIDRRLRIGFAWKIQLLHLCKGELSEPATRHSLATG
jgi:hypothetical protein